MIRCQIRITGLREGILCLIGDRAVHFFVWQGLQRVVQRLQAILRAEGIQGPHRQQSRLADQRLAVVFADLRITPEQPCDGRRGRHKTRRKEGREPPAAITLPPHDQLVILAAQQHRGQPRQLCFPRRSEVTPVVAGQRLDLRLDAKLRSVLGGDLFPAVPQKLRKNLRRLSFGQHTEHMLRPPKLQEGLQLMKAPCGLLIPRRADHDQILRGSQGFLDPSGKVAGDREFLLIPEDPVDSFLSRGAADTFRHAKPLQALLDLLCHRDIPLRPPVGNKGVIFLFFHAITAFVFRFFLSF